MDNGIGNCITFQAKVRSPIKGRDNIIRKNGQPGFGLPVLYSI